MFQPPRGLPHDILCSSVPRYKPLSVQQLNLCPSSRRMFLFCKSLQVFEPTIDGTAVYIPNTAQVGEVLYLQYPSVRSRPHDAPMLALERLKRTDVSDPTSRKQSFIEIYVLWCATEISKPFRGNFVVT